MKVIETKVYSFNELNDAAKQNAINEYLNTNFEFFWGDESIESIKKGLEHFNCEIGRYSIDFSSAARSYVPFSICSEHNEQIGELNGARLYKYLQNNFSTYFCKYDKKIKNAFVSDCIFTGYCLDNSFIQPVLEFLKQPTSKVTFTELIEDCIHSALQDIESDFDHQQSEEYLSDYFEANEYEFTEDGERF